MALQLVDAAGGGEVSLVSMAPNGEVVGSAHGAGDGRRQGACSSPIPSSAGLRRADDGQGDRRGGQRLGGADLIIAGTESSDGYTGTVPEQIAELLGLAVGHVRQERRASTAATLKVNRQTEAGYDEVECPLPAVVSVTAGVVEPRYPSSRGSWPPSRSRVDTVTAADLGVTPVGWAGAGQQIVDVAKAPAREAGEIVDDEGEGYAQDRRVPREPEGHLRQQVEGTERAMAIATSGCSRKAIDGAPTSATLELLTKARSLGGNVTAFVGRRRAQPSPAQLGEYGATKVYATGDLGGDAAGRRRRRRR